MLSETEIAARYSTLRIKVLAMLVGAPIAFLGVVRILAKGGTLPSRPNEALFYVLFTLAVIMGASIPLMGKSFVKTAERRPKIGQAALEICASLSVVKIAPIEMSYALAMVLFFLTGSTARLPYFYALGIIYSILFWPTKARFTELVRKLEAK